MEQQRSNNNKGNSKYGCKKPSQKKKSYKIFVGGLPSHTNRQLLQSYFKRFGWVKKCQPKMWKNNSRRCKGFAILVLGDKKTYDEVLRCKKHIFEGREIECKEALSRNELGSYSKDLNDRRVYVRGIPIKTQSKDLKVAYSIFGEVEIAYIVKDRESGNSLGFGYVTFKGKESRDEAVAQRNLILNGKVVVCYEYDNKKYEEKTAGEKTKDSQRRKPKGKGKRKKSIKAREKDRKPKEEECLYITKSRKGKQGIALKNKDIENGRV